MWRPRIKVLSALAVACIAATAGAEASAAQGTAHAELPQKLSETGLFLPGSTRIAPDKLAYSPQYPLWSDGATKRRWLHLPPGTSIDATNPDAWEFPVGTRLWKEFGYGRPVETRYIERLADGSWQFGTYVWSVDGRDAELAPVEGIARLAVQDAPGGTYPIPSRDDCLGCHDAAAVPVLGVSALQLSPDRDRLAPHAESPQAESVNVQVLHERGLLRNLPLRLLEKPPRIAASSPGARAALGYLHGNCGHCHNDDGPLAALDLALLQPAAASEDGPARTLATLRGYASEFRLPGIDTRVVPGAHASSMLLARMRSRNPLVQMPPLGTRVSDAAANALIERWIGHDLQTEEEEK